MDQMPYQRQNSLMSGVSNMTSGSIQDNEFSTQGDLPLRPNSHCGHGTPNDFTHYWALQEAAVLDNGSVSSQQFVPSTAGQGDLLYHNVSEFPAAQDVTPQNDFDFAHAHQDFHTYSPLADLVFDTDVCPQNGSQSYDDTLSVGQTSQADDKQMISAQDAWNSLQGSPMDQLSSNVFPALPVSPPLSEASSDICVTSSCSSSGYTSFIANDDALFADITTPVGSQGISLGDPLFPISPPLTEHDPNRTIRPSKQSLNTWTLTSSHIGVRWNLFDHMRRVHDFASVEQLSSPENSPAIGKAAKRKETSARKRRVNGVTGAQVMKRTRSNQSQASSGKSAHSSHNGQRLLDAERNYFNCRARLLEELSHITPQDSAMHEKVNASLQELITLGLNYRHIEASQMASQV
ncbi:hypothetical protein MPDQ_003484 [Monascus purpureus]|uniref:Uncharacterized protein n=1 Tax=Monascus purpureus TaxID=5098 RepID=A0A507QYZ9_MONPU|nr:hypothetical protein MPDQ_003484 [Monascus purpureus]